MKPTQITATGLKTGGLNLNLAPLTLVTGDNASGKTRVADAIRLGLLGYHPTLGSRNAEIMKLANGNVLEVEIDGMRRTWTRKGRSVSCEENQAAKDLVSFPPVVLDFDSFLQAKATARREIIEQALPAADPAAILREIETKLIELAISEEFDETPDFPTLIKSAQEKGKEWKQEAARLKASIQTDEIELSESETVTEAPDPDSFNDRLAAIAEEKGRLIAEIDRLKADLAGLPSEPSDPRPTPEEVTSAREALQFAKDDEATRKTIETRNAELRDMVHGIRNRPIPEKVVELRERRKALSDELIGERAAVSNVQSKITENERRLESLEGCPACPTCGTAGDDFSAAIKELIGDPLAALKDNFVTLKTDLHERENDLLDLDKEIEALLLDDAEERESLIAEKEAEIVHDLPGGDIEVASENLSSLEELAARWESFDNAGSASAISAAIDEKDAALCNLSEETEGLNREKVAARDAQAYAMKIARLKEHLRQGKEALPDAEKNVKAFKEVGDWAKARSLEVSAERLEPLLDAANAIIQGVIPGTLSIDGTDVGLLIPGEKMDDGGSFRPIEVLSGAETAVVAAAIQVAIASTSKVSFVIIDELSRLTRCRKEKFVRNLYSSIDSGLIEGAVVIDHDRQFVTEIDESSSALIVEF